MDTIEDIVACGNYAAIDIGSNAVRLLIKKIGVNDNGLFCTKEQIIRVPLRLGFDVFTMGQLSKAKAEDLVRLMVAFENIMNIYRVVEYKICATSAIRDAGNGNEIISEIEKHTGLHVDVLSGDEEAMLIYRNHTECIQDRKGNFMYVDVGGGSTEIVMLVNGSKVASFSYNIGTIRILNGTDAEEEWKRMNADIQQLEEKYASVDIIGSGGNINKLFKLVKERDKKFRRIRVEELAEVYETMDSMSVEDRIDMFKLRYDRADVIVPAAKIFLNIARTVKSTYIYVPTIGLADGIIDELFINKMDEIQRTLNTKDSNS